MKFVDALWCYYSHIIVINHCWVLSLAAPKRTSVLLFELYRLKTAPVRHVGGGAHTLAGAAWPGLGRRSHPLPCPGRQGAVPTRIRASGPSPAIAVLCPPTEPPPPSPRILDDEQFLFFKIRARPRSGGSKPSTPSLLPEGSRLETLKMVTSRCDSRPLRRSSGLQGGVQASREPNIVNGYCPSVLSMYTLYVMLS